MPLPLTYRDIVCLEDVDPFASETSSDLENLGQDVLHLLREYPDSNPDDPGRGIGVEQYLSSKESEFRLLPGRVDQQLQQDPRITSSKTSAQPQADGSFIIAIDIHVSGSVVPLQYGVSASGVVIL